MGKVMHVSKVDVHKEPGNSKIKRIRIEGWPDITRMGVHGGIAEFFKVTPDEPLPSTLDYLVAAIGACMTGTIAGALEGRGLRADPEKLEARAEGVLEDVDGKLLLTHVTVSYRIKVPKEKRDAAERALQFHGDRCPVSESVKRGVTVEWKSEIIEE
ncbi:MAG TPA: OsmC family protein [Bryobacteraceae bacterium]|nr:OsmC family protein [Bryobacteraceae bacterium]